ncbi:MAG: glycosyltransferase family 9 protein [Pseudomonadota bacterium]|nr:glycosyltransferase family 9 protein [Pseudomonadota bacterium]
MKGLRKILVVQPLAGIGDMVWHVPHLRALRRHAGPDAQIVLLVKARTRADMVFLDDPVIDRVIWMDRDGLNAARGGVLTLVRRLRQEAFDAAFVLHRSPRYAMAVWLAGIPRRYGYGLKAAQRWFLNRGGPFPVAPPPSGGIWTPADIVGQANALVARLGLEMRDEDVFLRPSPAALARVREKLAPLRGQPVVALGIGSSEPFKQYGAERFSALALALADLGWRHFLLAGGPQEQGIVDAIIQAMKAVPGTEVLSACDWPVSDVIAAQSLCQGFAGNDTGFLNTSAALGIRSVGLFGGTRPLTHSRFIIPVVPDGGYEQNGGMTRIDPRLAAAALGPPSPFISC